jgi:hypothetical protein
MITVGKLSATTTEQQVTISAPNGCGSTLIISADNDVEISINDNQHYQTYKYGEMVPLTDEKDSFSRLYYKTLSGTASIRFWVM